MIAFRYLSRELLLTSGAVSAVLLVIIMSGRFIKYLAQAAEGRLDHTVLFLIMAYKLPSFFQLILPLGLFLGVLLAYGRLYLDSEMTVLSATGMSQQRLALNTLASGGLVAILVAWLSLGLAPQGATEVAKILNQQEAMTEFDTLEAGRFQSMRSATRVTYTKELSEERTKLLDVFISDRRISSSGKEAEISMLVAEDGQQVVNPDGSRYLVLSNGYRYDGNPGEANYRRIKYDTYGLLLAKPEVSEEIGEREAVPTRELLGGDELWEQSELQWRLSLPLLVMIVTLLAVPLSRVNPRQGRYLKLLPAVLLYMTYLALLIAARGALDKGKLSPQIGLWGVHALFAVIALGLLYWEPIRLKLASRRDGRRATHG